MFHLFQVKIWFQNRRTKWKKQDNISNAEAAEHKNQTTVKQTKTATAKNEVNKINTAENTAVNLVKTEADIKLTISTADNIIKINENGVNIMKQMNDNAINLSKNENVPKILIKNVLKIPSSRDCELFKTGVGLRSSPSVSLEEHSNTSLFTVDGSVSESCFSELLDGTRLNSVSCNIDRKSSVISPSASCDNSQLSPGDSNLVIAENNDDIIEFNMHES